MRFATWLLAFMIVLSGATRAQSLFLTTIKDSLNAPNFGEVISISQDSLHLYAVCNSNFNFSAVSSASNGSIYYAKLNKTSGQLIATRLLRSNGDISRATAAFLYKNCLYIAGEAESASLTAFGFLCKFNTQTNAYTWNSNFAHPSPLISTRYMITSIGYNTQLQKLLFFGGAYYPFPDPISAGYIRASFKGLIDTAGVGFNAVYTGFNSVNNTYKTNPKFHVAANGRLYTIYNTFYSNAICLGKEPLPSSFPSTTFNAKELNVTSTIHGRQFVSSIGTKLCYLFDNGTTSTLLITDTLNNILVSRDFSGIRARSLVTANNSHYLTFVNADIYGKGTELITMKADSSGTIYNAKKLTLDTFDVNLFNVVSTADNNHVYHLFNDKLSASNSIKVYKLNFGALACNQQPYTPVISNISVSSVTAIISPTAALTPTQAPVMVLQKGLRDSLQCLIVPPTASFTAPSLICANTAYTFTDNSTNANSWQWDLDSALVPNTSIQNPNVFYGTGGIRHVTLTVSNAVGSNSSVQTITVLPSPSVSVISSDPVLCLGNPAILSASGAFTYTWNTLNGSLFGSSHTVAPITTQNYTVVGSGTNGCKSTAIITVSVSMCSGIEVTSASAIQIFPNPSEGLLNLELTEDSEIHIYNDLGILIRHERLFAGNNRIQLNEQASGIYLMKVTIRNSSSAFKIIKQ